MFAGVGGVGIKDEILDNLMNNHKIMHDSGKPVPLKTKPNSLQNGISFLRSILRATWRAEVIQIKDIVAALKHVKSYYNMFGLALGFAALFLYTCKGNGICILIKLLPFCLVSPKLQVHIF